MAVLGRASMAAAMFACLLLAHGALAARPLRLSELQREVTQRQGRRLQQSVEDLLGSLDLEDPVDLLVSDEYDVVEVFDTWPEDIGMYGGYGFYGYYGRFVGVYGQYGPEDLFFDDTELYLTDDVLTGELVADQPNDDELDMVLGHEGHEGHEEHEEHEEHEGHGGRRRLAQDRWEESKLYHNPLLYVDRNGDLAREVEETQERVDGEYEFLLEDEVVDSWSFETADFYLGYYGSSAGYYYGSGPVYGTYGSYGADIELEELFEAVDEADAILDAMLTPRAKADLQESIAAKDADIVIPKP